MKYKSIITVVIFILLTTVFAMSDDGDNKPDVNKVVKQSEQTVQVKSSETVNNRFGVDTGMTQKELDEFKMHYFETVKKMGILDNVLVNPKFKDQAFQTTVENYYNNKLNLNKIKRMKELGLFSSKRSVNNNTDFAYNLTNSNIILSGTIERVEYFFQTREEESKTNGNKSRYFVKVEEILKGKEYFKTLPNTVSYLSTIGKFLINSGDSKLKIGKKYILFLKINKFSFPNNDFTRLKKSEIRIEGNEVYSSWSDKYFISLEELKIRIQDYLKINNSNDFYRRRYDIEEDNNEN